MRPLSIVQGGFREGRSTMDQVVTLQELILKIKRQKGRPILALLGSRPPMALLTGGSCGRRAKTLGSMAG